MNKHSFMFYGSTVVFILLTLVACENDQAKTVPGESTAVPELNPELKVEQVVVPAGEFIRGSNKEDDLAMRQQYGFPAPLYVDEHPEKKIHLDAFKIDTYEVTNKQYKVLEYISNYENENGYMPTVREIQSHLELNSPSSVQCHINALQKKGYLKKAKKREPRTFEFTEIGLRHLHKQLPLFNK